MSAEYIELAAAKGSEAAQEDLIIGNDRSGEDVIADTEVLVHQILNRKLHEMESDEDEALVIKLVEAYDDAYINTYMAGAGD